MTVSVCIPMYNESETVDKCVTTLLRSIDSFADRHGWSFEIILCDDGSADDTREKALRYRENDPRVRVIGYDVNRGKGAAVREAILASCGDAVLYTDCDLAYGADIIEDAVERLTDGNDFSCDVLIGSRNLSKDGYSGYGFFRKTASKLYIRTLAVIGGFSLTDSQCGFKVFKGESAKKIFSMCECDGFAFDYEVLLTAKGLGMKISEMPVKIINHRESTVHVARDSMRMIKDIFAIKRRVSKKLKAAE